MIRLQPQNMDAADCGKALSMLDIMENTIKNGARKERDDKIVIYGDDGLTVELSSMDPEPKGPRDTISLKGHKTLKDYVISNEIIPLKGDIYASSLELIQILRDGISNLLEIIEKDGWLSACTSHKPTQDILDMLFERVAYELYSMPKNRTFVPVGKISLISPLPGEPLNFSFKSLFSNSSKSLVSKEAGLLWAKLVMPVIQIRHDQNQIRLTSFNLRAHNSSEIKAMAEQHSDPVQILKMMKKLPMPEGNIINSLDPDAEK